MFLSVSVFVPGWQPPLPLPCSQALARVLSLFPPSLPLPGTRCVKASAGCHSTPFLGSTGLRVLQPPTALGPLQPRSYAQRLATERVCCDTHKRALALEDAPNALCGFPSPPEMVPKGNHIACPTVGGSWKAERALQQSPGRLTDTSVTTRAWAENLACGRQHPRHKTVGEFRLKGHLFA